MLIITTAFSLQSFPTYANTNYYFIDSDIYDQEISTWSPLVLYEKNDLVLLNYKVYLATETIKGDAPGENEIWVCKADLTCLSGAENKNDIEITKEESYEKMVIEIPVLLYNGTLTTSKYHFTVRCLQSGG